jgi:hypothetical protein
MAKRFAVWRTTSWIAGARLVLNLTCGDGVEFRRVLDSKII